MAKDEDLKKTPLYEAHLEAGARMTAFAGWKMPVRYSGVMAEHRATRRAAGLFDVSHMGQIALKGDGVLDFLQWLAPSDLSDIEDGMARYTALLNERGGVIDDLIIYRRDERDYMLCVNAANTDRDFDWVVAQMAAKGVGEGVKAENISDSTALIALQGPRSEEILSAVTDFPLGELNRFRFAEAEIGGVSGAISRTGYTGEGGYEIFMDRGAARKIWDLLLETGAPHGLAPAGLGARDTLRLEMGYSLHGNDIDEEHTPIESGLAWLCRLDKGDFIGKSALVKQKRDGVTQRLTGLIMEGRAVPRSGYDVIDPDTGKAAGKVTSGTMSPSLGKGIALARVRSEAAAEGGLLRVMIRGKGHAAKVVRPPFYKKA